MKTFRIGRDQLYFQEPMSNFEMKQYRQY